MIYHFHNYFRQFGNNIYLELAVKLLITCVLLKPISLLVLIVIVDKVIAPIYHENCLKKLIRRFWHLRHIDHIWEIYAGFNQRWQLSALKNNLWIVNEKSFVHSYEIVNQQLVILNTLFRLQMSICDLTKVLIKIPEVVVQSLVFIEHCNGHF